MRDPAYADGYQAAIQDVIAIIADDMDIQAAEDETHTWGVEKDLISMIQRLLSHL